MSVQNTDKLETCRVMEIFEQIHCPYCGQAFELAIDTSLDFQRFNTDCEVCCRPMEIVAECELGTVLSLDVHG